MKRKLWKEFPAQRVWEDPNKSQTWPVATEALLAKDGSVITDPLLAKKENNKNSGKEG
ncbi:MAG: hypothetical protein J5518_10260 [Lachnospiraceae bacterium]|nr:hypothetical protein [Lachnospiraceae bacterium]